MLSVLCSALPANLPLHSVVRAASSNAYFTSVLATDGTGLKQVLTGGTAKVYSNQAPVYEYTTFFNNINATRWSIFYEVINVTSGSTSFSFTGDPLNVTSQSSGAWPWYESGGFAGSGVIHISIELFWNSSTGPVFEYAVRFDFLVVLLLVTGWTQSQATVQRGFTVPVLVNLSFTNGGNDLMYNTTLALLNSSGVTLQPYADSLGNIQTGGSVEASFSATAPIGVSIGAHYALFRISFADFRGVRHAVNMTALINLVALGTQITLVPNPSSIKVNAFTLLKIILVDNNGEQVGNAPVNLNIGSLAPINLQTDSSGSAVYQYQARNGSGVYLLRATFPGDLSLASSSTTSILVVNPLQTSLSVNLPGSTSLGQSIAFSATLLDETGRQVVGANVTFLVNDFAVGWVLTDASGVAVLYYFPKTNGILNVRASYLGSPTYSGSESTAATVNVAPASLFVIGGLDLTLPVFLAFAFGVLVLTARSLKTRWKE